jgi:hypothetical protein
MNERKQMDIDLYEGTFHDNVERRKDGRLSKDRVIDINRC